MQDQMTFDSVGFIKSHLLLPLIALTLILFCLEFTQLDIWFAKQFYNAELHQWPYRDTWLTQTVLHKAGRYFVYAIGIGLLLFCLMAFRTESHFYWCRFHLVFFVVGKLDWAALNYLPKKPYSHILPVGFKYFWRQ